MTYNTHENININEAIECGQNDESSDKCPSNEHSYMNYEVHEGSPESSGTSGSSSIGTQIFYSLPKDIDIFRDLIPSFQKLEDSPVKNSILYLLLTFQKLLNQINQLNLSVYLPPLQLRSDEDGSVLIEWIFKDFRIGFLIEPDDSESSWYLVSNSNMNELSQSGTLNVEDCESLLNKIISFVLRYV